MRALAIDKIVAALALRIQGFDQFAERIKLSKYTDDALMERLLQFCENGAVSSRP